VVVVAGPPPPRRTADHSCSGQRHQCHGQTSRTNVRPVLCVLLWGLDSRAAGPGVLISLSWAPLARAPGLACSSVNERRVSCTMLLIFVALWGMPLFLGPGVKHDQWNRTVRFKDYTSQVSHECSSLHILFDHHDPVACGQGTDIDMPS
jgi:hypothetical protein